MADLSGMYRDKAPSVLPKAVMAVLHLAAVVSVGWLLFGGGIAAVAEMVSLREFTATPLRRSLLLGASAVYFLRTLVTTFVFLKRRMSWSEVGAIVFWIGLLHLLAAFLGGRREEPVGAAAWIGLFLYVVGASLNTGSELQRHLFKQRPENSRKLYTGGLFRYSVHINYFGDLVLFSGWVLLTGRWELAAAPVMMFCGFAFVNVPSLDRYLAERYGEQFRDYAARTKKLIPFVY